MCWFCLDQNVIGNAVQCSKFLRNCTLFFVTHKRQIQLAHSEPDCGWKWEFYDLFELCGPYTAKEGIGFRLKMTSQWLEQKLSTFFSTGQLPNLRAQWSNHEHLSNDKRAVNSCVLSDWKRHNIKFFSSLPGILKPSHWTSPQSPKPQKGLDELIHQSTSLFNLGGTKTAHQANHYKRRWDHGWTAQLHKEKGPSLCLWPGALL